MQVTASNLVHCLLLNSRSICNKISDLDHLLSTAEPSVVFITETWLKPEMLDNTLTCSGKYSVFRTDRKSGIGGGVCILCNDKAVKSIAINIPEKYNSCEIVAIDIINSTIKLRAICCYRPPCSSVDLAVSYMSLFIECLNMLCNVDATILLCGDFNLPNISWQDGYPVLHSTDVCCESFTGFINDNALS